MMIRYGPEIKMVVLFWSEELMIICSFYVFWLTYCADLYSSGSTFVLIET